MKKDDILKPASFLLLVALVVGALNFGYNIVMGRMLSVADFGDLRALLSILMIFSVPISVIRTMIAKFTTEYYQTNLGSLKSLGHHTLTFLIALGLIAIVLFASLRNVIANYINVASAGLIVLLGPLVLLALIRTAILGVYQGLQRFGLLGLNSFIGAILKLFLGIALVSLGWATFGALLGLVCSGVLVILVFGLILLFLFRQQPGPRERYNRQDIYSYSGYALGVLICFAVISQIDVLIVKHKFLPQDAGLYAVAATIGKSFLFLPMPVVTVLFPKVVQNNKRGRSSLPILIQSLAITFWLCLTGIAVCFFFPQYLIKIFGAKYAQAVGLIKIFGLAMSPFALFYVLLNYFLSEYRLKFFYYSCLVSILGIALLFILPKSLAQFVLILGWYGLLIFVVQIGRAHV